MYIQDTVNCKGHLLDLKSPVIMGVLNMTPDSFYDGGRWNQDSVFLNQVERMLREGASIIDIGGMSSRPGAEEISVDEELNRVLPVVERIHQEFPGAILSIDTYRAKVAEATIQAGAHILNDISAAHLDPELLAVVAKYQVPYILMHMQGTPRDMQKHPVYHNVVTDLVDFFIEKLAAIRAIGIKDVILDPGFGFGKSLAHNYQLLKSLNDFRLLGLPILVGLSRKSMLYKLLEIAPEDALNATTAANLLALQKGANILRVHDVKEAAETIKIWNFYNEF